MYKLSLLFDLIYWFIAQIGSCTPMENVLALEGQNIFTLNKLKIKMSRNRNNYICRRIGKPTSRLATNTPPPPRGNFLHYDFQKTTLKKLSNHVFCHLLEVDAFAFYAMFHFITLNIQFLSFNNGGIHRKLMISHSFLILDH